MDLFSHDLESPIGRLRMLVDPHGQLRRLWFPQASDREPATLRSRAARPHVRDGDEGPASLHGGAPVRATIARALVAVAERLDRYFAGELDAIDDIAIAPQGSPLQGAVWSAVRQVAPGQVTTYGALATRLGHVDRRMARSIGMANAANPVAIVIPCHRVIGKDGSLRGYAWGLERKRWLLHHERARIGAAPGEPRAGPAVFA
jgi:methylated-DNA-[protein]-cysteine S-methyltransferase